MIVKDSKVVFKTKGEKHLERVDTESGCNSLFT